MLSFLSPPRAQWLVFRDHGRKACYIIGGTLAIVNNGNSGRGQKNLLCNKCVSMLRSRGREGSALPPGKGAKGGGLSAHPLKWVWDGYLVQSRSGLRRTRKRWGFTNSLMAVTSHYHPHCRKLQWAQTRQNDRDKEPVCSW